MKTRTTLFAVCGLAFFSPLASAEELSFKPDSAVLSGPFMLTNGCIIQTQKTSIAEGGRALFAFDLTNAGSYAIQVTVNARSDHAHLFGINIDAEPKAPEMVFDFGVTSGFEGRIVSWRGNGTAANPQFRQQVFNLSAGAHQIVLRGIEANLEVQQLALLPLPAPPSGLHVVAGQ